MIARFGCALLLSCIVAATSVQAQPPDEHRNGVVVAVSAPGAEAGLEILKRGGNAVDAAVATAFALAVTHPAAGNLGGGGFMLVYSPGNAPTLIDFREIAPAAATCDMFVNETKAHHHRAVGVPGTIRGMKLAHERFGKLPWSDVLAPAVLLAEKGFLLDAHHARSLNRILIASREFSELQSVYGKPGGVAWEPGDRLVLPELGKTLRLIASQGPDAFYQGSIADLIVKEMQRGKGLITREDLKGYRAVERRPVHMTYRGHDLYAPPPPSSGGTCLALMLAMLEPFELRKQDRFSPETLHLLAEVMRRAYLERARHLGDPAFTKIPDHLLDPLFARKLAASIDPKRATRSLDLAPDLNVANEGDSTTHFSVIDRAGLAVSTTYTLEHSYGSRIVVPGAGFLLNNQMTDFNWKPGVTTRGGLIGTAPNLIAPGKRMLSSQCPTIVVKEGKPLLITGSPGGRTIINTVLNVVVNVVDYDMPIAQAVAAPRLHHQWLPDEIRFEGGKKHAAAVESLRKMGHRVLNHNQGDAHSIWINPRTGGFVGAADTRLSGKAAGF